MKAKYCILVLSALIISCSQSTQSLESLLPEGHELLAADSLLVDSRVEFYAVVLSAESDEDGRQMIIYKRDGKKGFKSHSGSKQVVLCETCGGLNGDPFQEIAFDGSRLVVSHGGGTRYRWTRVSEFEFSEKRDAWILISDQGMNYDALEPEKEMDPTIYTEITDNQTVTLEDFNINDF